MDYMQGLNITLPYIKEQKNPCDCELQKHGFWFYFIRNSKILLFYVHLLQLRRYLFYYIIAENPVDRGVI